MTPVNGLQLLGAVQASQKGIPVILITAYATLEVALEAIKAGAFDFITKPFRIDNLLAIIQQALDYPRIVDGNVQLEQPLTDHRPFAQLVAKSPGMQAICQRLEQLALTDETVVIVGEPGAGKRMLAQILHAISRRKAHPFIAVDCAAAAGSDLKVQILGKGDPADKAGAVEAANGGTVLLENIEKLPGDLQAPLLRLMKTDELILPGETEARQMDVRLLATCCSLPAAKPGDDLIRTEWYQTLAAISLHLPPLRERNADLLPLISRLVSQRADPTIASPWKISGQAYEVLERYAWPNNVAELEEVLAGAMASAQNRLIAIKDLSARLTEAVAQIQSISPQQLQRTELRGKSFREYVRMKQRELTPAVRTGR
jgi:DNA-binding NtrC family response regulator